jgi:hypothetical protein
VFYLCVHPSYCIYKCTISVIYLYIAPWLLVIFPLGPVNTLCHEYDKNFFV